MSNIIIIILDSNCKSPIVILTPEESKRGWIDLTIAQIAHTTALLGVEQLLIEDIKKNRAYFRVFHYILAIVFKGKAHLLLHIDSNMSDGNGLQYLCLCLCGMIGSSCVLIGMMSCPVERSNELGFLQSLA